MHTALITHPVCLEHDMGMGHPECPDRLRAVLAAFEHESFAMLDRREAPMVDLKTLKKVHPAFYVEGLLERVPAQGLVRLDPDTAMCPATGDAAQRAAGAICLGVDLVMGGEVRNAFCAVRPPGHHAEPSTAMGFCFFDNVAVGAIHARDRYDVKRIAIVDFDVHHGNGSQSFVDRYRDFFFASSHQSPAYPGTGAEYEHGIHHNIVNVELAPGSGTQEFRAAWQDRIIPKLRSFGPELILISAGFDAHARDPLCQLRVQTEDFAWVTAEILKVANEFCQGRVVSTLEGGYDLGALAASAAVHVKALMEE
ncbi:MAG: histone deacetylase family protein [Hyphomicrobiales bacterium]|nr:histone deacetylase family protein [Hyphomicrobiales bacterium]MCP5374134.1 histone deacetylase family protein [Hyphomicrobiales bacterium]